MLERLCREVWKWLHVLAGLSVFALCVFAQYVHVCIDGWWSVFVAGVSFAMAFYILKHY